MNKSELIVAKECHRLSEAVAMQLAMSDRQAFDLIRFGAVYCNKKRATENIWIRPGDLIKVHRLPRRFPALHIDWEKRVLYEDEDFAIVNKPAGVPTHATCDNAVENAQYQVSNVLGVPVFTVQRLDIASMGLIVFAKEKPFQSYFHKLLRDRLVEKRYVALVDKPLPKGRYVHYMKPSLNAPWLVSEQETPGSKCCEMQIEKCREVGFAWHELEILLITGRHHQIRSQLCFLENPILGDALYGSSQAAPLGLGDGEVIALHCAELTFSTPAGKRLRFSLEPPW